MATTVSREPKTTLRANKNPFPSGFTLVEVLLVLAIIAMVMSIGLPAISRVTMHRLNSTTRQFVGLIRTVRNDAILLNQTHRLAINLDKNTYWVENQTKDGLLSEVPEVTKSSKKGEPPPSNFSISPKYSKEPKNMPGGVVFSGVYKEREGNQKEGIIYIHFFPNGFNDQAILYLAKEGAPETAYSLVIRPTSGRVDIVHETIKDFNGATH
jgi:prepilin-type N-terminal cleavage/methylation domain-containing protein